MKRAPRRRPEAPPRRWIQAAMAHRTPGALHRQLGVPLGEVLPLPLLRDAAAHPERYRKTKPARRRLARRARLALTLRSFARKRRRTP